MKSNIFFTCALIATFSSCSSWTGNWKDKKRNPSSEQSSSDVLSFSQSIVDKVATREFNASNCMSELDHYTSYYTELPKKISVDVMKNGGQDILAASFEARLALHTSLEILPLECKAKMKSLYLAMRLSEDFIGAHLYSDEQISAGSIKYPEQAIPIYEGEKYHPYYVGNGIDPKAKFQFKNGDIMITKGVSFVSSTISELASPKSVFSHIVFVHVDDKSGEVTTIESYVGKGVSIFSMEDALKNENARIVVLRPKDSVLAGRAANYMFDKVQSLKKNKNFIPYDYKLDFSDNTRLSCEEVAYDAFKTVSQGKVIIPELESEILLDDAKFLERVGVKKGPMMVPTDMETDSRFNLVLDWTDYRVIRDSWRKDALLGEMFHWIQAYDYKIYENMTSIAAKVLWSTRYIPGLWNMASRISGIPADFTKDVPSLTVSTMASLKTIGGLLLSEANKVDEEAFKTNGKWMAKNELGEALDRYRQTNPKALRKVFREKKVEKESKVGVSSENDGQPEE